MVRSFWKLLGAGLLACALAGTHGDAQQQGQTQPQPPTPPQGQAGQPPPAGQPQAQFRSGINFVRVDVIVSGKDGSPVSDLNESDFQVMEDGKPQKIETFKLVKLDGGVIPGPDGPPKPIRNDYDEEAEAARDDVRLFAVFMDDYHVRRGTSMAIREPLARFVENQLGPSDMIGLMYPLESTSSIRMTRNHAAVAKGIRQFMGRKYEYEPKNAFEEQYANQPTEVVERIRVQVSLSALKALIIHMGSLKEGRKQLIIVSEGFSYMLPPQMRNAIATMPGSGNPNANNPMAGSDPNDITEDRAQFAADNDMQSDLRSVYDAANHNNVALYTFDPRGLAVGEFDIADNINLRTDQQYLRSTQDTLRTLAEQTDGRALVNRNDFDNVLKQVVRDESAFYLIGYNSATKATDGKFHEIKVKVARPGVQVRSRKGYWALTPEEATRATAPPKPGAPPEIKAALATVGQPTRQRLIRTWIGTSRGENGKTKVTFVWEPIPHAAGDVGHREDPQRVSLMAVGDDGSPFFRGRVPDVASMSASASTPAAQLAAASAAKGGSKITFEVPPGKMQLRVSVEGAGSQVLDSEVKDLTIPDLTAPQATLGSPEIYRARTPREMTQFKSDLDAVPTASRDFLRTDRLLIRLPAYGPGGTTPAVTAKLLNREGQPMSDLPVAAAPGDKSQQQVELSLANLPAGEYIVEIKATGGEGAGGAQQLVGFRISS